MHPPEYLPGHRQVHPPECLPGHRQVYPPEYLLGYHQVYPPERLLGYRQEYLHRHRQYPYPRSFLRPLISPTLSREKILLIGQLQVFLCHILYGATTEPLHTRAVLYQRAHRLIRPLQVL